jgi:hypothetical protein
VQPTTTWYGDESYDLRDGKAWYCVGLARPLGDPAETASALTDLVRGAGGHLHFHDEKPARRIELCAAVRRLGFETAVAVWQGEATPRRARSSCLKIAARELHGTIDRLVLESIDSSSDERDRTVLGAMHPVEHRIPVTFAGKRSEPLIWVPDLVAGAAHQAFRHGRRQYLAALGAVRLLGGA